MRPAHEVADVIRLMGKCVWKARWLTKQQKRTLRAIAICRTARLGWHRDRCSNDDCRHIRISYNSCRNRHCPKCQATGRERWINDRIKELLPVSYYHVVFTLPHHLNELCLGNPKPIYDILFRSAWETINDFARDPKHLGALPAMTAILHTWGQNLAFHPHLHCIVPGGGITDDRHWKHARVRGKFLFPVKAMSKVYRAKFVAHLRRWATDIDYDLPAGLFQKLFEKQWVIYAKRPFGGPAQVIEYLGRYTHKVAISNHRIAAITDTHIRFSYKDYKQMGITRTMTLTHREFIRRFALHVLPPRFVRIRHFGFLAARCKSEKLPIAANALNIILELNTEKLPWQQIAIEKLNFNPNTCPCCSKNTMVFLDRFPSPRAPPLDQTIEKLFTNGILKRAEF